MQQLRFYNSSIGKKIVMAGTGLFLIAFLAIHLALNATILIGERGELFDRLAEILHQSWWLQALEVCVFLSMVGHIIQGISLTIANRSRRQVAYAVSEYKWFDPARSMGVLGAIILGFLLLHLYQFWWPQTLGSLGERSSLSALMRSTFNQRWVVVIYLIGCGAVAAHLWHGWRSAAITLGWDDRSIQFWQPLGIICAIGLPLGLALIPIAMLLIG
jgi:succinate dehydrogenase / fumarate reductase, cytochrome b subunit